jgi:hypothetical protein
MGTSVAEVLVLSIADARPVTRGRCSVCLTFLGGFANSGFWRRDRDFQVWLRIGGQRPRASEVGKGEVQARRVGSGDAG